ncbi:hypothetical protein VNI00_009034 [Paramarasmius palmivorus]|uniref:F-box domain-containing protein n=1 Tax=Paramarasmius palmivorus TaxID=297713 RepID=A0AAW0CST3_9AGAR
MRETAVIRRTILCNRCRAEFIPSADYPPIPVPVLRSNAVPTKTERIQTIAIVELEIRELQRYVVELAHLRRVVDKLESEKAVLEQRINQRKNWSSTLRRMPPEIWRQIFSLSCEFVGDSYVYRQTLQLSQVSSNWRDILSSFPELWSSFQIDLHRSGKGTEKLVELYLQYAGAHPLRFKVLAHPLEQNAIRPLNHHQLSVLRMLVSALPRCSELNWTGDMSILGLVPHSVKRQVSFPRLQTCTLSGEVFSDSTRWFRKLLSRAPQLREVSLELADLFDIRTFPYHRLTSVSCIQAHPIDLLKLLKSSPSLSVLAWGGLRLECTAVHPADLEALFNTVSLPFLSALLIHPFNHEDNEVRQWGGESSVLALLERSKASLQTLALTCNYLYLSLPGLGSILGSVACSGLTFLELLVRHDVPETPAGFIFSFMGCLSSPTFILPRLTHLRLHEMMDSNPVPAQTVQSVIRLAEARHDTSVPALQDFEVLFSAEESTFRDKRPLKLATDDQTRVTALSREGMVLNIMWATPEELPPTSFVAVAGSDTEIEGNGADRLLEEDSSSEESEGSDSEENSNVGSGSEHDDTIWTG